MLTILLMCDAGRFASGRYIDLNDEVPKEAQFGSIYLLYAAYYTQQCSPVVRIYAGPAQVTVLHNVLKVPFVLQLTMLRLASRLKSKQTLRAATILLLLLTITRSQQVAMMRATGNTGHPGSDASIGLEWLLPKLVPCSHEPSRT